MIIVRPNFRKSILLVLLMASLLLLAGTATTQQARPITKEQLINALSKLHPGDSQAAILNQVRLRGVDFELTPLIETELRNAGARPALIVAVRSGFRRQATPTPTATPRTPLTLDSIRWEGISTSQNPEVFFNFLKNNPNSSYADNARARLKELSHIRVRAGMEMVWIAPGSFMMGSTNGKANEKPIHKETINQPFYIGKYEVTQAQWQAAMGNNPSKFKACGGNCPVEQVSWDDAQQFINKLNESNDGFRYRLPTEAEWEYACRAGTTGDYAGHLSEMAWYSENSETRIHAVGGKRPNGWGLADMHGNVFEWCQDWYHDSYNGAPTDGSAWLSGGEQKHRVLRGGSWVSNATYLRSAYRGFNTPEVRGNNSGFRVVAVARTQ